MAASCPHPIEPCQPVRHPIRTAVDPQNDRAESRDLDGNEIDGDDLVGTERDERREVCGLCEGGHGVEHALRAAGATERPRDLDRPLVA